MADVFGMLLAVLAVSVISVIYTTAECGPRRAVALRAASGCGCGL